MSRLWGCDRLNSVILVGFRDAVARVINSQYMSMGQTSLLKLNDIGMSFGLTQYMSFCKVSNQLPKLQLKYPST